MYKKIHFLILLSILFAFDLSAQLKFEEATILEIPIESFLTNPTPSPNGDYLAFSTAKYQGIYLFNLQNNKLKQVETAPSAGWRFKWSTTGNTIAYRTARYTQNGRKEHAIATIEIPTEQKSYLTNWDQKAPGLPVWSSQDSEIVFSEEATPTQSNLKPRVYNRRVEKSQAFDQPSEGLAFQFTDNKVWKVAPSSEPTVIYENPKGYPILNIHTFENDFAIIEEVGSPLLKLNLNTGSIDTLAQGEEASISPDGKTLLFRYSMDDGHNYIYSEIVAYDLISGKTLDRFSSSSLMPFSPVWKPNGEGLYFSDLLSGRIYELAISGLED